MIFTKNRREEFDDMSLLKTLDWIERFSGYFVYAVEVLKEFEIDYSQEVEELISTETITRYKGTSLSLKYPYQNFKKETYSDELEQGLLVQSWSNLGSLLESTFQMFLAFYYRDYIKSKWNTWDIQSVNVVRSAVKEDLNEKLKQIVVDDEIEFDSKDRNSFFKKILYIIKEKEELTKIDKLTLEPLINFYFSQDIFISKQYSVIDLRKIRDYRNSIHSFQKREVGTWDELNRYAKLLLVLLMDMIERLPDIPDYVPWNSKFYDEKTNLLMQEQQWFEFVIINKTED